MADFAIVAEGITDQIVLKNILLGFFADQDEEPLVAFAQPPLDTTGQRGIPAPGGWSLVLKFFESGRFLKALEFDRYLVIQIDTDRSGDFGIPHQQDGRYLTPLELIERVVQKFRGLIGDELWQQSGSRFLFAITVHTIECWLLPLYFRNDYKPGMLDKIQKCLPAINDELYRLNQAPLSTGDGDQERKDPRRYDQVSKPYRKRKDLLKYSPLNASLDVFVKDLEARGIQIPSVQPGGSAAGAGS